ncbi:MAG: hypothetical protein HPY45_14180 [Anaerolineae bacterium]|nr:hypothetical protein [Anaerolineae bacterium]
MNSHVSSPIPPSSAVFFQEYVFDRLECHAHAGLMIERLLAFGNRTEVRWLFDQYGAETIRRWVEENGSRRLPRNRYHLWCVLLKISEENSETYKGGGVWQY